jgi:Arc/MetJ-type ribon-helix-helix transcriptional regulator
VEDKNKMINIAIPESLLERVEDFRFEQRFKTRAEAIRYLMEWALDRNPQKPNKKEVQKWRR